MKNKHKCVVHGCYDNNTATLYGTVVSRVRGTKPVLKTLIKRVSLDVSSHGQLFRLVGPRQHGIANKQAQYGLSPSDPRGHSTLFSGCVIISTYVQHSYIPSKVHRVSMLLKFSLTVQKKYQISDTYRHYYKLKGHTQSMFP